MKVVKNYWHQFGRRPFVIIGDLTPSEGCKKTMSFGLGFPSTSPISHSMRHGKGFIDELKKEGYVDGKNIQIDFKMLKESNEI